MLLANGGRSWPGPGGRSSQTQRGYGTQDGRKAEVRCECKKTYTDGSKLPFVVARTGVQRLTVIQLVVGEAL